MQVKDSSSADSRGERGCLRGRLALDLHADEGVDGPSLSVVRAEPSSHIPVRRTHSQWLELWFIQRGNRHTLIFDMLFDMLFSLKLRARDSQGKVDH